MRGHDLTIAWGPYKETQAVYPLPAGERGQIPGTELG